MFINSSPKLFLQINHGGKKHNFCKVLFSLYAEREIDNYKIDREKSVLVR